MLLFEDEILQLSELLDVWTRVLDKLDLTDDLILLLPGRSSDLKFPLQFFHPLLNHFDLIVCGIDLFLSFSLLILSVTYLTI